ncbi:hypothetical protein [Chitinimonas sp. JJ19]|uniref:hypothetical protein n=1 Tax=Chitinimonas sp. JJ19 TaxID=3109352 RepID=UPI002FFEA682
MVALTGLFDAMKINLKLSILLLSLGVAATVWWVNRPRPPETTWVVSPTTPYESDSVPMGTFDPAQCRDGGDGNLYFAFGRLVMKAKASEILEDHVAFSRLNEKFHSQGLPTAPDPSQPKGCYDNPMQAYGFGLLFEFDGVNKSNYPEDDRLQGFGMRKITQGFTGLVEVNQTTYATYRNGAKSVCTESYELIVCGTPGASQSAMMARQDRYTAPDGRPFVTICLDPILCQYSYVTEGHEAVVSRRFSMVHVPLNMVIPSDRKLRQLLASRLVENYPWPENKESIH